MSQEKVDNINQQSPSNLEGSESARKRIKLDHSARKSWSLSDKRTDQEALEEMGVSLLEPDDNETCPDLESSSLLKSGSKRKRDIENINPNINSANSSTSKTSPKRSPRRSGGSPAAASCAKQSSAETTILESYSIAWIEEETPEQLVGEFPLSTRSPGVTPRHYTPGSRGSCGPLTPLQHIDEDNISRHRIECPLELSASFNSLSDEVMLGIFKWLPKRTLAHCMCVSKRWHRVASDESFWQRLELGNRTLAKDALGQILARKPVIVRLAGSEIGEWHPPPPVEQSRIQYLDLSMCSTDRETLLSLLLRSLSLKKLSLEGVALDQQCCEIIGQCNRLESLNLTMASGITADGLKAILEGCQNLQSLNLSWCNLCATSLQHVVTLTTTKMQRLNIAGARIMTDDMVIQLADRCPRLLELDLSDCHRVGESAASALLQLRRLEHLALSRCYLVPPHSLTKLSAMQSLQYLEVWGMLQTASLSALRAALPAIQINQYMHSAIARPTVGTRRTSVWGLRTRD